MTLQPPDPPISYRRGPAPGMPVTTTQPPQRRGGASTAVVALVLVGAAVSWGLTIIQAFSNRADVEDATDSLFSDVSAMQISQLVDQALLNVLPLMLISLALSFAAIVAVVFYTGSQR